MDDKRTPMEAEVQELLPKREPAAPGDFYGTSAKPKPRRKHTGFLISLSLVLIAASTVSIISSIFNIRLVKQDGMWQIQFQGASTSTQTPDKVIKNLELPANEGYTPVPNEAVGTVQYRIAETTSEALTPNAIYEQVAPAVVRIDMVSYYGTYSYTGVVLSTDGYILSATDGLSNATAITVSFADGRQYSANRVEEEWASGLCLLKIEAEELPTVAFDQNGQLTVGQPVYCICNPYGKQLPNVFYDGMLAATGTVSTRGQAYSIFQTSGQCSGVGSGCPILNNRGLVIGMTTPIGKRFVSGEDPCFAVCAADLTKIIQSFESSASSTANWLGFEVEEVPEVYRSYFELQGSVWIAELAPGSKAYGVLHPYDVIVAVDGNEVSDVTSYEKALASYRPGDAVVLTIYRSGELYTAILPVLSR